MGGHLSKAWDGGRPKGLRQHGPKGGWAEEKSLERDRQWEETYSKTISLMAKE